MRVQIGDKRWNLRFTKLRTNRGDCEGPQVPNKTIRIDSGLKGEERLEVIIHECLHASDWRASEEHVESTALSIANILWRLGYRHESDVST